jgi:hypothetical protein
MRPRVRALGPPKKKEEEEEKGSNFIWVNNFIWVPEDIYKNVHSNSFLLFFFFFFFDGTGI